MVDYDFRGGCTGGGWWAFDCVILLSVTLRLIWRKGSVWSGHLREVFGGKQMGVPVEVRGK